MEIKNYTVVTLSGIIDQLSGEQLDDYLKDLVNKGDAKLILDFSNVEFTSSEALRALLGTIKYTRLNGGDIFLTNISPLVDKILQTTGFSNLFSIYSNIDSVLTSSNFEK